METPNYYEERAKRTLSSTPESENNKQGSGKNDDLMDVLKKVAIDAGISVAGGGLGSATLGQYSFLAGFALTAYAHYERSDKLRTLGIGLMASSPMTHCAKQDPKAGTVENTMERLKAFGEELKRKLFLDKLVPVMPAPKNELKQIEDLKGTEQKTATPTTQTDKKPETNKTMPPEQIVTDESEYLDLENTIGEFANPENEIVRSKSEVDNNEDYMDIAERLL